MGKMTPNCLIGLGESVRPCSALCIISGNSSVFLLNNQTVGGMVLLVKTFLAWVLGKLNSSVAFSWALIDVCVQLSFVLRANGFFVPIKRFYSGDPITYLGRALSLSLFVPVLDHYPLSLSTDHIFHTTVLLCQISGRFLKLWKALLSNKGIFASGIFF